MHRTVTSAKLTLTTTTRCQVRMSHPNLRASELAHFSGLEVDAPAFIDLTKNWVAKRQYTSVLSLPNPNASHLIDGSNGLAADQTAYDALVRNTRL